MTKPSPQTQRALILLSCLKEQDPVKLAQSALRSCREAQLTPAQTLHRDITRALNALDPEN